MREANDTDLAEITRVISERGYLVIGTSHKWQPGDRFERWIHRRIAVVEHPLIVVSETDAEDLRAQIAIWGSTKTPNKPYYYRCITD